MRLQKEVCYKRGDFVTTGTTTQPMPFEMGDKIIADFGELGEVRCEIEKF